MAALFTQETEVTKNKKVRKANFSVTEISVLTEKVEENLEILNSKVTNTITNQNKAKIWSQITDAVNAVGNERRTPKEIKDKWKNLNSTAKKEYCQYKKGVKMTGGGPPPKVPSETSNKIIDIFGDTPQFNGLDGFESDIVEKYGQGEIQEMPCPRCNHPVEIVTAGVHYGSSQRIYTDADAFECPKCFFKEDSPMPVGANPDQGDSASFPDAAQQPLVIQVEEEVVAALTADVENKDPDRKPMNPLKSKKSIIRQGDVL